MKSSENKSTPRIPVVDFVPAELKKGNKGNWRIEYYIADPTSKSPRLKRKQIRVRKIKNTRERERFAKRLCFEINRKLERGWNPIIEQEAPRSLTLLNDVIEKFINNTEKQVKDQSIRPDTLRAYRSYLKNFQTFLKREKKEDLLCLQFNRDLIGEFLDYVYYYRNNSPRTYNNYLGFLSVFSKYMLQKGHIKANPALAFSKKAKHTKTRTVIDDKSLRKIFETLQQSDPYYYTACAMIYYELTRRTEMSKLLVRDIRLAEKYILMRGEVSKNRKTQSITILKEFIPILARHLNGAANSDYLFSENFKPGPKPIAPKRFSDHWTKWKKKLELPDNYKFYSFKDTGITNLLKAGVPAIYVKEHARHHDIAMTQQYIPENTGVNSTILDGKL